MSQAHTAVTIPFPPASPAAPLLHPAALWETGTVSRVEEGVVTVLFQGREEPALVASSCLVSPEKGDEALLAPLQDGRLFILAVLTRQEGPARMHFPHGVAVESDHDISLASATAVRTSAVEHSIAAGKVTVQAGEIEAKAGICSMLAGKIKAAGDTVDTCFSRLFARLGSSRRIVTDHDETQAASSRLAVSGTALLQAGTVNQTASELVRIDAPQVHLS